MSRDFENRLNPVLPQIAERFGTPFIIYDEKGIWGTGLRLKEAFRGKVKNFREFFAVKACPNPEILKLMKRLEFGFDCSSIPELVRCRMLVGAGPGDIMFTSNNTSREEFEAAAMAGGCILNLDDISLVAKVPEPFPELICLRYNPGRRRTKGHNGIIGKPWKAKYGLMHRQMVAAYKLAMERGAKRVGIHTMICSNERNLVNLVSDTKMLLEVVEAVQEKLGIPFEFINRGGGIGVQYHPVKHKSVDIELMAEKVGKLFADFRRKHGYEPEFKMECGRFMTASHGVLVTKVINLKNIYEKYRQVDACMNACPRPAFYGAYHHITVHGKDFSGPGEVVNVSGSLCENWDRFTETHKRRLLPKIEEGDLVLVHEAGAHSPEMGSWYNDRLRPKRLILRRNGSVELIQREDTIDDLFASLKFGPKVLRPKK